MKHTLQPLLLVAALTATASAQLPVRDLVPADSKFVFAFDLQATLDLLGRDLIRDGIVRRARAEAGGHLKDNWDEVFVQEWGFDPFVDLKGFMLFGDKGPHDGATVAVITTSRIDATLERLRDVGALEASEQGGVEVMQIVPGKVLSLFGMAEEMEDADKPVGCLYVHRFGGRNGTGRALVLGEKSDAVRRAAKAMREGDTLGKGQGRLATSMREGDLMYVDVDAAMADLLGDNPASKLTSKARRLTIQVGQNDDSLTLRAVVVTAEEKDARQIAALVNGLKALLALADPSEEMPQPAYDALMDAQAKADGNTVSLEVSVPKSLLDEARREIRRELGDGDGDVEAADAPRKRKVESKRERAIR